MKKSERNTLANIVSEMIYSFQSSRELVNTGRQILSCFPSIADDVDGYRYPVALSNVSRSIASAAFFLHNPLSLDRAAREMHEQTFDSVEGIFEAYLANFNGDEFHSHLYEIENKISDSRLFDSTIAELFQSDYWKIAVANVYEVGTAEFNHLTNTK